MHPPFPPRSGTPRTDLKPNEDETDPLYFCPVAALHRLPAETVDLSAKALSELERIERVSLQQFGESYYPGDTVPDARGTTMSSSATAPTRRCATAIWSISMRTTRRASTEPTTGTESAVNVDHDRHEMIVDDFSTPRAPYGLTATTFFSRRKPLRYVLTTGDPIRTAFEPCGEGYRLRLDIDRDCIVEFWGPPLLRPPDARTLSRGVPLGL